VKVSFFGPGRKIFFFEAGIFKGRLSGEIGNQGESLGSFLAEIFFWHKR